MDRLRIGMMGCGLIAQVMTWTFLDELRHYDEEIAVTTSVNVPVE